MLKTFRDFFTGVHNGNVDEGLHCAIYQCTLATCSECLSHHLLFGKSLQTNCFVMDHAVNIAKRANDVIVTNLQLLYEFCHFSYFNEKRQKVKNSLMLISVCLFEFRVYK